jgi:hypothetical protein
VGTTGLIYAAIAFAWLAYLIPTFLRRREAETPAETDPNDRFSDSVRIIRSGSAPLLDQDLAEMPGAEVSTPLTRRAAIRELRRLEASAAGRRRRVLLVLMILLSVAVAAWAATDLVPWWVITIPAGLLVGFFVVSRFSVAAMHRDLGARYERIRSGSSEATVVLSRKDVAEAIGKPVAPEASQQVKKAPKTGGLWDPLPITMPTYVSKPLAPRTVRTIDLASPELSVPLRTEGPVTADRPAPQPVAQPDEVVGVAKPVEDSDEDGQDRQRAVGE